MNKNLIVLLGPTGIGKTDLSIDIAMHFNTDILSSDSRQFYKELRIGTAVPTSLQLKKVKHHFIWNKSIHDYYNVSMYEQEVLQTLEVLFKEKDNAFLVGGSGLYIDAVCKGIDDMPDIDEDLRNSLLERIEKEGVESLRFDLKKLDPESYANIDLKNKNRLLRAVEVCLMTGKPYSSYRNKTAKERDFKLIKIGLRRDREELYERINMRVDMMMEEGLLEEAKSVFEYKNLNALKTVGYRELFGYFEGIHSLEKAIELIKRNSRHYAKRQITWFARDKDIKWFHPDDKNEILKYLSSKIKL